MSRRPVGGGVDRVADAIVPTAPLALSGLQAGTLPRRRHRNLLRQRRRNRRNTGLLPLRRASRHGQLRLRDAIDQVEERFERRIDVPELLRGSHATSRELFRGSHHLAHRILRSDAAVAELPAQAAVTVLQLLQASTLALPHHVAAVMAEDHGSVFVVRPWLRYAVGSVPFRAMPNIDGQRLEVERTYVLGEEDEVPANRVGLRGRPERRRGGG